MSTPPITERASTGAGARRAARRVSTRTVWLTADVIAIVVCALLALRGF